MTWQNSGFTYSTSRRYSKSTYHYLFICLFIRIQDGIIIPYNKNWPFVQYWKRKITHLLQFEWIVSVCSISLCGAFMPTTGKVSLWRDVDKLQTTRKRKLWTMQQHTWNFHWHSTDGCFVSGAVRSKPQFMVFLKTHTPYNWLPGQGCKTDNSQVHSEHDTAIKNKSVQCLPFF